MVQKIVKHLVEWWDGIPLGPKLYLSSGIFIFMLISLGAFAYAEISTIQKIHIPARAAAREMDQSLLNMAIYERELLAEVNSSTNATFYLERKSLNYTAWQENYLTFGNNFQKLQSLYHDTTVTNQLRAIEPEITAYRDKFIQLMKAYQERGFKDYGHEGAMRIRAHQLEDSLKEQPDKLLLLQLRQYEKDFFLRKELADVANFDATYQQLANRATNPTQRMLLTEYHALFHKVVKLDETIGLTSRDGLRGDMRQIILKASAVVGSTQTQVLSDTDAAIDSINQAIFAVSALFIILAIPLAFIISRSLTRRIQALLLGTQKLAKGDLRHRVSVSGKDELGILAHNFNQMAEALSQNQHATQEHAQLLAENVRKFQMVSKAVHEAIYDWSPINDTLTWSEGLSTFYGYHATPHSMGAGWWLERIHPDDREVIDKSLTRTFHKRAQAWHSNYRFKKANGQYADVSDRGFIEYDKQDQPLRMVGSLMDITHQKELERAKDEFISVASHQLRTPLGSLRWNLELLLEQKDLTAETRSTIQDAFDASLRMLNLVADLLNVARIEQGRGQSPPSATDLLTVLHDAIAEMHPIAQKSHITIDDSALKTPIITMIDANRFREAIQNLLSNAVKYTPERGKVIVKASKKDKVATISIADNGLGIPEEEQSKLFSKFFRASNVTRTGTEGTGLGLFVVKSYVEGWGGKIWFKSQVNKGTTFYITVPIKKISTPKSVDLPK